VFPKKIELEQWQSWRRRRLVVLGSIQPKKGRMCTTYMWSHVHDELAELFINRRELLILLFQGHNLFRLGARYWLGASNSWDTTGHPYVLGRSVGESVHPIFIGSSGWSCLHPQIRIEIQASRRIVLVSLPQLTVICLLKIKKEIIIFNSRK
jgi:hypothetical protein